MKGNAKCGMTEFLPAEKIKISTCFVLVLHRLSATYSLGPTL